MILLADLKTWLGVTASTDDTLLTALETRAVAFVQTATGRHFGAVAARTEYYSGDGSRVLWLRETPAASPALVISIEEGDATWTVVETTDYVIRDRRLVHNDCWDGGEENYKVVYSAGYTAGAEPGEIRQLVMDLCALKYARRMAEHVESETIAGYAEKFTSGDIDELDAWGVIGLWQRAIY